MKNQNQIRDRIVNPVKLADNAVLTLSALERKDEVSEDRLNEAISLCDYLLQLLESSPSEVIGVPTGSIIELDREALHKTEVKAEDLHNVRNWLTDITNDRTSHGKEDLEEMQALLVKVTMPMWRSRTSEFRERKLRRSLILHG